MYKLAKKINLIEIKIAYWNTLYIVLMFYIYVLVHFLSVYFQSILFQILSFSRRDDIRIFRFVLLQLTFPALFPSSSLSHSLSVSLFLFSFHLGLSRAL